MIRPSTRAPIRYALCAGVALVTWIVGASNKDHSILSINDACADAASATACGQRCDGEGTYCHTQCVKKEEPCFKACQPTAEEAKKHKKLEDNKCLSKCAAELQPCLKVCHKLRSACRSHCPSP